MVKMNDIFRLGHNDVVDDKLVRRIAKYGFSRIPVFDGEANCVGVLWAKSLLDVDCSGRKTLRGSGVRLVPPLVMSSQTNLLEALSIMEQRKMSLALIHESDGGYMRYSRPQSTTFRNSRIISGNFKMKVVGLITLKDIFERMVERDFEDHDQHLRSMVSQTYFGSRQETHDNPPKLTEVEDPEEYATPRAPLLKHEVV